MDFPINCLLCGKKFIRKDDCVLVKERGLQTLRECSDKLGDKKSLVFKDKTEIKVHEKCRIAYLKVLNKIQPGSSNSSSISTRSASSHFEFSKLCLFCGKDYYQSQRKKCVISSDVMTNKLLSIAKERNDNLGKHIEELISQVASLTEAKARYHRLCFNDFSNIKKDVSHEDDSPLEKSLKYIYSFLEDNLECQFVLSDLLKKMEYKPMPRTLIANLQKHFGTDITISGVGKKSIVTYSGTGDSPIDDNWYLHQEQRKEDEYSRLTRTIAELIRKEVKITQYNIKTFPSSINFLDNAQKDIPKYLNIFLEELLMYDVNKKKTKSNQSESARLADNSNLLETDEDEAENEDDNVNITRRGIKKDYIAHSIISALRPKSFNSSLQLATGLYINRKSGSKLIVDLLAKLGVCASYHSVAMHEHESIYGADSESDDDARSDETEVEEEEEEEEDIGEPMREEEEVHETMNQESDKEDTTEPRNQGSEEEKELEQTEPRLRSRRRKADSVKPENTPSTLKTPSPNKRRRQRK